MLLNSYHTWNNLYFNVCMYSDVIINVYGCAKNESSQTYLYIGVGL